MIKRASFVAILLAIVCSSARPANTNDTAAAETLAVANTQASASARAQFEALPNGYQERLKNKSVDRILELYSAAPVFIPEYAPPAVGREAVDRAYEWVFATLTLDGHSSFTRQRSSAIPPGFGPTPPASSLSSQVGWRRRGKQRILSAQARERRQEN